MNKYSILIQEVSILQVEFSMKIREIGKKYGVKPSSILKMCANSFEDVANKDESILDM